MALKLSKVKNKLFDVSKSQSLGIEGKRAKITKAEVYDVVGEPSNQYTVTTSYTEITGMNIKHSSETGRTLIIFNAETSNGISEAITCKLQRNGVDVSGTIISTYINAPDKTDYWSCSAQNFKITDHGVSPEEYRYDNSTSQIWPDEDTVNFIAPVHLPHGATVTGVIVNGDSAAGAETWYLYRSTRTTSSTTTMASASINSEDTSISNAVIDNNTYVYFIGTTSLDTDDTIYGARIKYTPEVERFQNEGPLFPISIMYIFEDSGDDEFKIMTKKISAGPVSDSFINDRVLMAIDI